MTESWDSIIEAAGDTREVSEGLGAPMSTVSGWKSRGIPARRWSDIVRMAADRGRSDITLEVLADIAARKPALEEVRA